MGLIFLSLIFLSIGLIFNCLSIIDCNKRIDKITSSIKDITDGIDTLNKRIKSITDEINTLNKRIKSITDEIDTLNKRINSSEKNNKIYKNYEKQ